MESPSLNEISAGRQTFPDFGVTDGAPSEIGGVTTTTKGCEIRSNDIVSYEFIWIRIGRVTI